MNRFRFALFAPAVVAAASLAACTPPAKVPVLNVHGAQTTVPAIEGNPSAVYFTITGGPEDVKLLAILGAQVQRAEIHESSSDNGVVSMKQLTSVDVPAKSRVEFKPGGKHVMVWGINQAAVTTGKMPMTFVFSNGDRIAADVKIGPVGGAAGAEGAEMDHSKMDMGKMDMGEEKK